MAVFNYEEFAANLPDSFRKDSESNNHKLLEVEKHIYSKIQAVLKGVYAALDLDNASGKTLDLYGERLQLARGNTNDAQYRIRLKGKIGQALSDGSRESVAEVPAYIPADDKTQVQAVKNQIQIKSGSKTGKAELVGIPLEKLFSAGFTTEEITELINSLLAENVVLTSVNYYGTFTFSAAENELSRTEGFADEQGQTGGFLGLQGNI